MPTPSSPITLAEDGRDAWDRQPSETQKRWSQFTVYRDLGRTRTLKRVAERLNVTHRTAQQYAHTYRWNPRCEAFDRHMDEQWVAAIHERQRRMVQDHLKLSQKFLDRAVEALDALSGQTLNATEAVRVADTYSKLIRFALGEPDQSLAVHGGRAGQPISFTHIPGDEASLRRELEAAVTQLARTHAETGEIDPYAVLDLPD